MSRVVPLLHLAALLFAEREQKPFNDALAYLQNNSGSRDKWKGVAKVAALKLCDIHSPNDVSGLTVRLAVPPNPAEEAPGEEMERVPCFVLYASDESGLSALEEYILYERGRLGRDHPRVVEALNAKGEFEDWQEDRRASATERHARLNKTEAAKDD